MSINTLPDGDIRLYLVREKVKELIDVIKVLEEKVDKQTKELDKIKSNITKDVKKVGGKRNGKA